MKLAGILAWGAAVAIGSAGGYELGKGTHPSGEAAARPQPPQDMERVNRELAAVLASQSALQAEVAALGRSLPPEATAPAPPPVASSPAPAPARATEALVAEDDMRDRLDSAIRAGHWTSDDRDQIRAAIGKLDDDTRLAFLKDFSLAVNNKRLAIDVHGPPL